MSGVIACCVGLFYVMRAYGQTTKTAEPDAERVRRFVESVPLDRLANMKAKAS